MATPADVRKKNILAVLKVVANEQPCTKTVIAQKTGLTLMTVNTIVNSLLTSGGFMEYGTALSDTGRKAYLYKFNDELLNIAGVNIEVGKISFVVSDISLNILNTCCLDFDTGLAPEHICSMILKKLKSFDIPFSEIGITVPGPVDRKDGYVISLPNLRGWKGFPLKTYMEDLALTRIITEKDNYAGILYLRNKMNYQYTNMAVMTIIGGIGTGLILNGSLFTGETGTAGEIGHLTVDPDGPLCNCGSSGCLELYASDFAIINSVHSASGNKLSMDEILKRSESGDMSCSNVIRTASEHLGLAVSNAIKHFDPACFIINSRWVKDSMMAQQVITDIVSDNSSFGRKISPVFLNEKDIYVKGALMLARDDLIQDTDNNVFFDTRCHK